MMTGRVRLIEYEPWLLGFCRWAIVVENAWSDSTVVRTPWDRGSWRWRGRGAKYAEWVRA